MERSIENIWKEGFESEDSIQIPVIRDLYRKKSKLIIERIKSTSRTDNISLIPIAIILAGIFIFLGKPILGVYVASLILFLFLLNRRRLRKLNELKLSDNTYLYLKSYYSQVKALQKYYTILLGIGLPLLILPAYWMYFKDSAVISAFLEFDGFLQLVILIIVALLMSGLGILSYRLSFHILYSKLFYRLKGIIQDMEELTVNW